MNGVAEIFSLLKFLRIKPYNNWTHFRAAFKPLIDKGGHHKHAAMDTLRALLKAVMMRRKKDSKIDGKPILQLPEKTEELVYIDLSNDERDFYVQLELKSQVQFSKYLRDNSIGRNYSKVFVLLLRLRQACCHPHLNLDVEDSVASLLSDEEMMEVVGKLDPAIVSRIKELQIFECPICYDYVGCPFFFGQCGHLSCAQCFIRLVDGARAENLQEGEESDIAKCPVCRASFDMKKIFTYDIFRKKYLPGSVKTREEDEESSDDYEYDWTDNESESDDDTDSEIDEKGNLKDFIDDGDDDLDYQDDGDDKNDDEYEGGSRKKPQKLRTKDKKGKGKAKKVNIKPSMLKTLRKDATRNQEAYRKYMAYLKQTWLPSAKVSKCIELVQQAAEDGEKIIVFSQWTLLLDLIQVGLKHEKFRSELRRYDGSMSGEQRFEAAREFRDNKKVTAMLVSLRAGNAGLNLTAASRVIIMDPFWNPYVERQAVDRAYRIGQHKKVTVYRILTKETIEDRIVALQERKQEMVEAALDEAEGVKISRLDVRQLKFLFNTAN
ncbi:putative ATP-dependent helicase [Escovopsis weberi]|uniref:Putative ATP-dependent helicase n=1 Tax=Escovopsis weberi TaxID=150374 RepID=A0A0N0RTT4_ESCWE|nr:putative ATP-dependent helicase [Escovopsis weberi]